MPLYQAPSTRHQASRLLPVDLQSGWVELNWLCGPILRSPLFISCIPPIFSHSRKEIYTSPSPITINFEIITQCLTTLRPCDIIPDYKVPSVNWFVRKSTFNAWHTPKGSYGRDDSTGLLCQEITLACLCGTGWHSGQEAVLTLDLNLPLMELFTDG